MRSLLALLATLGGSLAFVVPARYSRLQSTQQCAQRLEPHHIYCSEDAEEGPSDVEEDLASIPADEPWDYPEPDLGDLKSKLMTLAAMTARGQTASEAEKDEARFLTTSLEQEQRDDSTAVLEGTWELIFSDTQLFRSSPFFMAGRAVCADGEEAQRYDAFCDLHRAALAISEIGRVRQVISSSTLVSEFEVKVGAVPFVTDLLPFVRYSGGLPLLIEGAIVSTASVESSRGLELELLMDTVEIRGSNVPGLRQALDAGLRLQSRDLGKTLESVVPSYANPRPLFKTTYLDDTFRISRDQDGKCFVYSRTSGSTVPTDYSGTSADLGISTLVERLGSALF